MASQAPAKRQRANTAGDTLAAPATTAQNHDLETTIDALDVEIVRSLLLGAAQANESLASLIRELHDARLQKESARAINFDWLSKESWKELNVRYDHLRDSKQYDRAGDVSEAIRENIEHIQHNVMAASSWGTKKSALGTLRKIGKSICLSSGVIPKEVRKDLKCDDTLVNAMMHVTQCMKPSERGMMLEVDCDGTSFENKLIELEALADAILFAGLKEVRLLLGRDRTPGEDSKEKPIKNEDQEEDSCSGATAEDVNPMIDSSHLSANGGEAAKEEFAALNSGSVSVPFFAWVMPRNKGSKK
jgi:hypothetical protein